MNQSRKRFDFKSQLPDTPFKSDGCSGGLSKWWGKLFGCKPPISESCYYHDVEYHWGAGQGATWLNNAIERLGVDLRFGWSCFTNDGVVRIAMAMAVDHGGAGATIFGRLRYACDGIVSMALAPLVFIAVRLGGGSYRATSYRWGFGWNN